MTVFSFATQSLVYEVVERGMGVYSVVDQQGKEYASGVPSVRDAEDVIQGLVRSSFPSRVDVHLIPV